jgi:hypothetical protein
MKTEKDLHKYLRNVARERGILFHKLESKSGRGFPDVMLAKRGKVIFVELKSPSGTGVVSELQKKCHVQMRKAGLDVRLVNSVGGVVFLLCEF